MIGGTSFLCKRPSQSKPWNHLQQNHNIVIHGEKQPHTLIICLIWFDLNITKIHVYCLNPRSGLDPHLSLLPCGRWSYTILTVVWLSMNWFEDKYDKTLTYFFGCRWFRFYRIPVFRLGCLDTTFLWGRRRSFLSSVGILLHLYLSG